MAWKSGRHDEYIDFLTNIFIDKYAILYYNHIEEVIDMDYIRAAIENSVPLSSFNKGQAGRIFEEVKNHGAKIVMKNNLPECVLLSPAEYIRLIDELNDARLEAIAAERLKDFDLSNLLSQEEVDQELGLSPSDYEDDSEVEFE